MRLASGFVGTACGVAILAGAMFAHAAGTKPSLSIEDYLPMPMPPGFQVFQTESEGPVFADAQGHTFYRWPTRDLRNGDVGEQRGQTMCDNQVYKENSGLMSPYPPGLALPELDKRPSCVQVWPPVYAADDAKPVGRFTILKRADGRKQWAYDGSALYTSVLDKGPGDVNAGTHFRITGDQPGNREPVGPPANVPPQFVIHLNATGQILATIDNASVYVSDKDGVNKSNCRDSCLIEWMPMLAPHFILKQGKWDTFERAPGVRQWSYRGKPLYIRKADSKFFSLEGGDVPGWHNVYVWKSAVPPKEFTVQDTFGGQVLADAKGKTIYVYNCADDALDQLACDHPDSPQVYRFAICGGGDPKVCLKTWPPVLAAKDAKSPSQSWTTMDIDPMTGHRADPNASGVLHVWAYRGKPVYTFSRDREPGDYYGDALGEFNAWRNGFKAFWLRDDFRENAS